MFVLHLRSAGNTCRRATAVLQAWGWNHQSQQESPEIGGSSEWPDFWHDYAWWSRRNLCGSAGRPWRRVSSGPSRDSQIQVRFLDRISINVFETWRLVRRFDTPHGQLRRKHVRFCTACKSAWHWHAIPCMPRPSDLFLFLQVCAWGCGFSILFVARRASAKTIETNFPHVPGDLSLECSKQSGLIRKCFLFEHFQPFRHYLNMFEGSNLWDVLRWFATAVFNRFS